MTLGLKFGADFLAYEGDPFTCHAEYMVRIINSSIVSVDELVLSERMAQSIKKDLLLVYPGSGENELIYSIISH